MLSVCCGFENKTASNENICATPAAGAQGFSRARLRWDEII
jgi:hypothetical protein